MYYRRRRSIEDGIVDINISKQCRNSDGDGSHCESVKNHVPAMDIQIVRFIAPPLDIWSLCALCREFYNRDNLCEVISEAEAKLFIVKYS